MQKLQIVLGVSILLLLSGVYFISEQHKQIDLEQDEKECSGLNGYMSKVFVTNTCGGNYIFNVEFNCNNSNEVFSTTCVKNYSSEPLINIPNNFLNTCKYVSTSKVSC